MNFRDVLAMLYRRKWIAVGFFICALGGGYVGLSVVSPVFRSTAQVMVHLGQEDVFMPVLPSSSSEVRTPLTVGGLEQRTNSEIQIIESEPLAAQVVAKFGPAGLFPGIDTIKPWYTPGGLMRRATDAYRQIGYYFYPQSANETVEARAVRLLRRSLNATAVKESTMIEVAMDNAVPEIAASSVNELVRLYLQQRQQIYRQESSKFFGDQLAKLSVELQQAEQELADFHAAHRVIDVDQQRDALLHRLTEVSANLQNENVEIGELHKRIALLQSQLGEAMPLANVPIQHRIRDDLLQAQSQLGPHQDAAANWARLQADLTAQAASLTQSQPDSARLIQHVQVLRDTRKLYLQKIEETQIQQAEVQDHLGNVSVVNWAVPDKSPVSPKLGLALAGILGVGVVGGIGLAILFGLMDDTIVSEAEVVAATGLPVIGRVRSLPLGSVWPAE
jgi:uncharacterized protein involved in exopolysaccharide biosynthesis